jgi:hypothetical protein
MWARPDAQVGAITIARVRAPAPLSFPMGHKDRKEMNQRKQVEELAKKLGVSLAAAAGSPPAPAATPAPVASTGFMAKPMPVAAAMMADLKAQLDPEIWKGAMDNLKRGAGYVIDHSTRIAVGSPPVDLYERGRVEKRDGFTIMRVRLKRQA